MSYQPREDSLLLASCVSDYCKGKTVLDMCGGLGIQALAAMKAGAYSVLAADIDRDSVSVMKKAGVNAVQSDLFSNVPGRFDLIVCNPPYLPEDALESEESALATSGGKAGDEFICRFLEEVGGHLNINGKILLLVSSLTPRDRIENILAKHHLSMKVLKTQSFFMETLEVWLIERIFK